MNESGRREIEDFLRANKMVKSLIAQKAGVTNQAVSNWFRNPDFNSDRIANAASQVVKERKDSGKYYELKEA